ncbi:hypothetical protein YYC_04480 [Plasmodium yoelii 17X]|uniref:Uncharacterized protein n=1 Tax=Plasmodium yoelii 17X TaxID=1323249 RepID=V7PDM1_PLAYE|nr:hypothetical protein YYC_04480 [Plasmodium yoelii 17X]
MKYLIVGKQIVGKNIQTKKKEFLYFFRINKFSSTEFIKNDSIFDLIAKKKKKNNITWDNNKFIKNGEVNVFGQNGEVNVFGQNGEVNVFGQNGEGNNTECDVNKIENVKHGRDNMIEKGINNYLEHFDNDIYNNKLYILRYAKYLNENDDIYKYRFITKYVIKNITRYYDNEILFILKIFAKKKYKNIIFLQCASEYFYWLCKLNKGNKKNISYYLYYCSILNYIPTIKYIEEYIKIFDYFISLTSLNNQTNQIKFKTSHIYVNSYIKDISPTITESIYGNLIKEETDNYHKDVKYIIYIVYFLNKANIKNEIYNRLLDMCCYYSGDLTLNKSFLLLDIAILNIENNIYNFSYLIKNIHKNIERHINLMDQSYFIKYINILLYNNIKIENSFFLFIKKYIEKYQTDLSPKSILAILKIKKKKKFKDTIILKDILNIVIKSFYKYTYDNILYILKVLTFFKYFHEIFFKFIFNKYVQTNYLTPYQRQNVYTNVSKSNSYISLGKLHPKMSSRSEQNLIFDNESEQNLNVANESEHNLNFANDNENENENDLFMANASSEIKKNKKINNLSHLPLHLNVQETKIKINPLNIVNNEIVSYNKINNPILFNYEYIDMYITLFIYMGINYYRDVFKLNELSQKIKFYLLSTKISKYNNLLKKTDIPIFKKKENQYIGFFQIIDKIKEHENSNLKIIDETKESISFPIIHNEKNTKQDCHSSKIDNKHLKHDINNDSEKCNKLIKEKSKGCLHFNYNEIEKKHLYKSEKYTDKSVCNVLAKNGREKKIRNKQKISMKKYKKIKIIKGVCMLKYKNIFKNKSNIILNYINKMYECKSDDSQKYTGILDMISKPGQIHIDDFIFGNNENNISLYKRKIINKHNNLIYSSVKNMRKEYLKNGDTNSNENKMARDNEHTNSNKNYIIKWIYRYINNLNIFNQNKKIEIKDIDIQKVATYLSNHYTEQFLHNNEKIKIKISLKNISLFSSSFINLYFYDKDFIDLIINEVLYLIDIFYNLKKTEKINNKFNLIKEENCYVRHFVDIYKFLIIYLQINNFINNILEIDQTYQTLEKLIKIYTHNYYSHYLKCVISMNKYAENAENVGNVGNVGNAENGENGYKDGPSTLVDFYSTYFDVSIFSNSFYIFNKLLFISIFNNYYNQFCNIYSENLNKFAYKISETYLTHLYITTINNLKDISLNRFSLLSYSYNNKLDLYFTCINFYTIFISRQFWHFKQPTNYGNQTDESNLGNLIISNSSTTFPNKLNNLECGNKKEGKTKYLNLFEEKTKYLNVFEEKTKYLNVFEEKTKYLNLFEEKTKYLNLFEGNKHKTCKTLEMKNIYHIYKTLNIFFKYIKFVRNNNLITDINTCNKYFDYIIQFYYIFKTHFRKLKINYINEQNYHQIFPLFFIKILNKKNIKEISITQSFFVENDPKKDLPNQDNYFKNEFIYNYFHAFFFREKE